MLQRNLFISLACTFMFLGCASLSKEECATASWNAIGYGDGSRGEPAGRFNTHQKACAEHGYSADFANYKAGHQRGLEEVFCKPRNAYQLGLRGGSYQNVCPAFLEQEFLSAYGYGQGIHQQQRSYNALNQQITQLKQDIVSLDAQIANLEHEIGYSDHTKRPQPQTQRNEYHRIEKLYHDIENTQPISQQSTALTNHLRHELTEQKQLVERLINQSSSGRVVPSREKQLIRTLANQAIENGQLTSQIQWLNRNPKLARTRTQQTAILQQQLQQMTAKLNTTKNELRRYDNLELLISHAEYQGALRHHSELLALARDQYTLNLLIDVHFTAELNNFEQPPEAGHTPPDTRETQHALRQLYHELREARRQRHESLHRLDDLQHQLVELEHQISDMKARSHYQ